jgi:hypothetical protein
MLWSVSPSADNYEDALTEIKDTMAMSNLEVED